MSRKLFVNLPVRDLKRAKAFFAELGFGFNPKYTDEAAACLIVGGDSFVMLLAEDFFRTFTRKSVVDARQATEVLVALSCASDDEVKQIIAKAKHAGGTIPREPQDLGFMYQHAFEDLDGHIWELVHMRKEP